MHCLALRYKHHAVAQSSVIVIGLLSGPLLAICVEAIKYIQTFPSSMPMARVSTYLEWLYLVSPGYALISGILKVPCES